MTNIHMTQYILLSTLVVNKDEYYFTHRPLLTIFQLQRL